MTKADATNIEERLLLVTFPVDLGNRTLETLLVNLFKNRLDLRVHRFAAEQSESLDARPLDYRKNQIDRIRGAPKLWREVVKAKRECRTILFHNISPALFAYPALRRNGYFIATDWTRKLYEPFVDKKLSPRPLTALHGRVLRSATRVLGFTDAVLDSLEAGYGVPPEKLAKVRIPFDIERIRPRSGRNDGPLRLLFVGGDMRRKGGHRLLEWYRTRAEEDIELTVVSNADFDTRDVKVERGVQYGQDRHLRIFQDHDVLVCPTMYDGYPQVIAEAAAAGLIVIATERALGAPDVVSNGVNGWICESPDEVFQLTETLIGHRARVEEMKRNSRELMERRFSSETVYREIAAHLFR